MEITLLHNPKCSTSRAALAELESAGVEFDVVEYLDNPLNEQAALDLLDLLEDDPKDIIRRDDYFTEQGLTDADLDSKHSIAQLLVERPKLMQRPLLIAGDEKAIIGRPKERVPAFIEEFGTKA